MKSFNLYFSHRFKSTLFSTLVMGVLCLTLIGSFLDPHVNQYSTYCNLDIMSFVLIMLCTLIPILELSGFKNRRNLDTLFFLPVSRAKMAIAHYLNGLIQILVIHTANILFVSLQLQPFAEHFSLSVLGPYYLFSLILGVVMYSVFSFVFIQANTVADGVVFQVLYIFVLAMLALFLGDVFGIEYLEIYYDDYLVFYHIAELTNVYEGLLRYATPHIPSGYWISYTVWCVLGLASIAGYVVTFVKRKAEKIGGISDSPFGYKVLIPLLGVCCMQIAGSFWDGIYLFFICMVIGYIIYRRSFKLKRSDIVMLVATTLFSAYLDTL